MFRTFSNNSYIKQLPLDIQMWADLRNQEFNYHHLIHSFFLQIHNYDRSAELSDKCDNSWAGLIQHICTDAELQDYNDQFAP